MNKPETVRRLTYPVSAQFLHHIATDGERPGYLVTNGIPADAKVVNVFTDPCRPLCILLQLEHESFPEVAIAGLVPEGSPPTFTHAVAVGESDADTL